MDLSNSNKNAVEIIRNLCKERSTSLTKLEAAVGFGNGTIGKWANAPKIPPHDKLEKVRIALDVPLETLLGQSCVERDYYLLYRRNRIFVTMFRKGLSLEQLAKKSGIDGLTIRAFALLEKTAGMRRCLQRVADVLSVNASYLLGLWGTQDVGADWESDPYENEWAACNNDPYEAYKLHQAMAFEKAEDLDEALEKPLPLSALTDDILIHGKSKSRDFPLGDEIQKLVVRYSKLDIFGKAAVQAVLGEEEARVKAQAELEEPMTKPEPKIIPLYLVPAAAGYASPIYGSEYENYTLSEEDPQGAVFAIKVQGDSMEPYFPDGSIVFCNHDSMSDGDIGVFCLDGDSFIKQYHYDRFMGMTYLFSLNRKRAEADKLIPPSSNQTLTCMGRVITQRRYPIPCL